MKSILLATCISLTMLGGIATAQAQTQIHGTRVIYPAEEREVTVQVDNVGKLPRLLQVWIDSGNDKDTAETANAPFLLTPPMARVEPGKGQAFRMMFTGGDLPQDRESVFWFNVLEIPPRPENKGEASENFLQFAVRSRLKIFYRPKGLQGDPLGALETLTWRLVREGGQSHLECANSSAYNVSIANVRFKGTELPKTAVPPGGMCPAKGAGRIEIAVQSSGDGKLVYNAINDYGGFVEREASYAQ